MSDGIKITSSDRDPVILHCFQFFLGVLIFSIILMCYLFFFKEGSALNDDPAALLRKEVQQTLDEVIALKMGMTKKNGAIEARLLTMEENQKRLETNGLSVASFMESLNKRIQAVEILPGSLIPGEKQGSVDWENLVKKQLAPMPSTRTDEWSDVPLEKISEALRGIDRLLATKGGGMEIVTGDELEKFFKELPQPLVLVYGDTLWPGQGQLNRSFVQNVWRTETIREIQRRAVLRALGKKTN